MKEESQIQFDFTGSQLRDAGIELAESHANAVHENWSDNAFELIKEFLVVTPCEFMTEDIRAYASMIDFDLPPDARAWAGPLRRAKKEGLIQFVRHQPTKNKAGHCRPGAVWIKKV